MQNWLPWLPVGGIGILGALMWLGLLPALTKALGVVLDVIGPFAKLLADFTVAALRWLWSVVIWPDSRPDGSIPPSFKRGVLDIADDWVTVVTVAAMGFSIYAFVLYNSEAKLTHSARELQACQVALSKARRPAPKPIPAPPLWDFKWPF